MKQKSQKAAPSLKNPFEILSGEMPKSHLGKGVPSGGGREKWMRQMSKSLAWHELVFLFSFHFHFSERKPIVLKEGGGLLGGMVGFEFGTNFGRYGVVFLV